jgi:hypothetical protein
MILAAAAGGALPWMACGGGGNNTTTTTGTIITGHGGHTTSVHASSASSSGGTGGGGTDCTMGPFNMTCEPCVEMNCCAEAAACYNDTPCNDCLTGMPANPNQCNKGMTATLDALSMCLNTKCNAECIPHSDCDPVTNQGCNGGSGEACDLDQNGVYTCFPAPNTAMLCATCSNANGPFCAATMHCIEDSMGMNGKCARYCCNDGDCGGGKCDLAQGVDGTGICVTMLDAGNSVVDPACNAPMNAPSNGSCYTGKLADGGTPPPPQDAGGDGSTGDGGTPPADAGGGG